MRKLAVSILSLFAAALTPSVEAADCFSIYDESLNQKSWLAHADSRYTICHDAAFADDVPIAVKWIEYAYEVAEVKYGISHPVMAQPCGWGHRDCQMEALELVVYLHAEDASRVSPSRAYTAWCWWSAEVCHGPPPDWVRDPRYRTRVEVHMLTLSEYDRRRGIFYPAGDPPHEGIKTLVHEVTHFFQFGVMGGPDTGVDDWITEGLAEYEGWMTTAKNKDWMLTHEWYSVPNRMARRDILFGWTAESLNGATTALRATEPYYAGAAIVIVLADLFGEGIHRELLIRPLNEILAASPSLTTT